MSKVETLEQPTKLSQDLVKYNRGQLVQLSPLETSQKPRYQRRSAISTLNNSDVVCVDWFETQLTGQLPSVEEGKLDYEICDYVHLRDRELKTKNFSYLFDVYYYGEHVGTLQSHTRASKYFDPYSMQFKMLNHLLYTEGWLDIYRGILNGCNWCHKSTTRLDIAIDGVGASNYRDTIYQAVNSRSKVMISGKTNVSTNYKGNEIQSVTIGSRSSSKYGRIYNKTEELKRSNKTYIKQYWVNSSLSVNPQSDVWRIEMEMKSELFKSRKYDIWRLEDSAYLASIMRTELKGWLSFYRQTNDTNKYRTMKKNQKELIDWETIGGQLLPKAKAKKPSDIFQAKAYIKACKRYKQVFELSTPEEVAKQWDLEEWAESKEPYWHVDNEKERERLGCLQSLIETNLN